MEIRTAYSPSSDILLNSNGSILSENSIVSAIERAVESGEVRISAVKKELNEGENPQLDSSFVYFDAMPGY